ncbi:alpha/beta hydrolase [Halostella sp. PRR32]|uniref:alpha/beta fold hydrolase n=1 Tax=Halostella sp. PRR32 TaxID=3098147 RepID=UPI002B1D7BD8|nr:alpha/beta hydrolase [Halostella sp. PRR32]
MTTSVDANDPDGTVDLPDGRTVAYDEYGSPDGVPVIYHHGTPGSRLLGAAFDDIAESNGVRLIAPDRPGTGQSDPVANRSLGGWADDAVALADGLGVDEFGVLGFSGGGPHALAVAARHPERVDRVALVSTVGPPSAPNDGAGLTSKTLDAVARRSSLLTGALFRLQAFAVERSDAESLVGQFSDRPLANFEERTERPFGPLVEANLREAYRQGSAAAASESRLFVRDWGFDIDAVAAPVRLWHGEADTNAPPAAAAHLAERLPDAKLTRLPNDDHLSALVESRESAVEWFSD